MASYGRKEELRSFILVFLMVRLAFLLLQLRDASTEVFLLVQHFLQIFKVVWHGFEATEELPGLRDRGIDQWHGIILSIHHHRDLGSTECGQLARLLRQGIASLLQG
ncbi:hypothetical protein PR202_ga23140 [Eleusine coracana subsp. coracana]|uniref:Secreted protein n=1 Tax=Eleusine coracana subsp. coracana TaxID=191504 RepID=A0AAV5D5H8_ELECO|nr:hypothetical protein PR202_ga23140 [Eleusine coracana subsp. coracana]